MGSISLMLVFSCFSLLVGDMLFGYDTGSFGGILANSVSILLRSLYSQNEAHVPFYPGLPEPIWNIQRQNKDLRFDFNSYVSSIITCLYWQMDRLHRCRPGNREIRPPHGFLHPLGCFNRWDNWSVYPLSCLFEVNRSHLVLTTGAVEITAAGTAHGTGRFAQFILGRIIVYISVGLVEVDVT